MSSGDQQREQMWDLIYGLLSDQESAALIDRIKSDPKAARLYAEVRLQADLVGAAARVEDSSLVLKTDVPADKPMPAPPVRRKAAHAAAADRRGDAPRGGGWLAGLVATALALLVAAGYFWPQPSGQQIAQRLVVTEVELADALQAGLPQSVAIRTRSLSGEGRPAAVDLSVLAADGRELYEQQLATDDLGRGSVAIPGDALEPGVQLQLEAAPPTQINNPAAADAARGKLSLLSDSATSLAASLPVVPEPQYAYFFAERPIAQAGEPVEFAMWNIGLNSGKLVEPQTALGDIEAAELRSGSGRGENAAVAGALEAILPEAETLEQPLPGVVRGVLRAPPGETGYGLATPENYGRQLAGDAGRVAGVSGGERFYVVPQPERQAEAAAGASLGAPAANPTDDLNRQQAAGTEPLDARAAERGSRDNQRVNQWALSQRAGDALTYRAGGDDALGLEAPQFGRRLDVKVAGLRAQYQPGERVRLQLEVTDEAGQPAAEALVGVRVWYWNEQVAQAASAEPMLLAGKLMKDRVSNFTYDDFAHIDAGGAQAPRSGDLAGSPAVSPPAGPIEVERAGQEGAALGLADERPKQTEADSADAVKAEKKLAVADPFGATLDASAVDGALLGTDLARSGGGTLGFAPEMLKENAPASIEPLFFSNRDAVVSLYEAELERAKARREAVVATLGSLLMFGGVIGIVLLVLLALFRMPASARTAVPAVAVAAASVVIGLAWVGWVPKQDWQVAMAPSAVAPQEAAQEDDVSLQDAEATPPPPKSDLAPQSSAEQLDAKLDDARLESAFEPSPDDAVSPDASSASAAKPLADLPPQRSDLAAPPADAAGLEKASPRVSRAGGRQETPPSAPQSGLPPVPELAAPAPQVDRRFADMPSAGSPVPPPPAATPERSLSRPGDLPAQDAQPEEPARRTAMPDASGGKAAAGGREEFRQQGQTMTEGAPPEVALPETAPGPAPAPAPSPAATAPAPPSEAPARARLQFEPATERLAAREPLAPARGGFGGAGASGPGVDRLREMQEAARSSEQALNMQIEAAGGPSPYFNPQLVTNGRGRVAIEFDMPPVEADFRLLIDALGRGRIGSAAYNLACRTMDSTVPAASQPPQ